MLSINLWYSNRNSFEEIKNECKKNVKVILLRNKTDLEKEREIPSEEAALLALKIIIFLMNHLVFKIKM